MKKTIAVVLVALVCGAGVANAEGFSAGPRVGVFMPDKGETAVLYGVEARKDVAPRFTAGLSIMAGELSVKRVVTDVVLVPQEPIVIVPEPITVQPDPITVTPPSIEVDCRKSLPKVAAAVASVAGCKPVVVQPDPITITPDPITVQPDPIVIEQEPKRVEKRRTVKRKADVVLALAQGAYRVAGPVSLKGGLGVVSIDGEESLAVSAGVGVDVPVSERVAVSASADYLHLDAADGVLLSASVQYRF